MQALDVNNNDILVDEEGYIQFQEELEKMKLLSMTIASKGSEEYENAVGDGWHDNFAFEESMRESRMVAQKINKMMADKKRLKVITKQTFNYNVVNIGDILKIKFNDDEIEIVKLTGKYIPNENDINEISLNSPLGRAIYKKKIGTINEYEVNDKIIRVEIIKKIN